MSFTLLHALPVPTVLPASKVIPVGKGSVRSWLCSDEQKLGNSALAPEPWVLTGGSW